MDIRWFKLGDKFVEESLVKWKQLPTEDATWEDTTLLHNQFPYLDLEDKDPIGGGVLIGQEDLTEPLRRIPSF